MIHHHTLSFISILFDSISLLHSQFHFLNFSSELRPVLGFPTAMYQAELTSEQVLPDPFSLPFDLIAKLRFRFDLVFVHFNVVDRSSMWIEIEFLRWHCVRFFAKVLRRDIPWETYMSTKLISGTSLQLLRRYDHRPESHRAQLLDDVIVFNFNC